MGGLIPCGQPLPAPCCSRALWQVPSLKKATEHLPMRAPQPWPFSSETDWRLWRGYLDDAQMPHLATLKREADAEIARIVRCRYGRREPKRPAAVPPQRLPLTDARWR